MLFLFGRKKPQYNIIEEPMQKIINIVKDYLTRETNNALLITGEWGVGKTYFFDNKLSEEIKGTSIKENESVKYKPIRVSLSGVTNIDDIERRIVAELYPSLNKEVKWGKEIFKLFLSIPKIKEYIPEIPNSDVIDSGTNNLVICFDDLERISKTFPIDSLIGYINNLTENNNLKTIIIANTDKIKDESFDEIKEKLIGREIEYKINIEEVFDILIQNEFQSFSEYTKFLQKEKEFICSFFQDYKNIRTLKFILSYYHDIFSQIGIIAPHIGYIQSNKNNILKRTLLFTIAIAIEFKRARCSKEDKETMSYELWPFLDFIRDEGEDSIEEDKDISVKVKKGEKTDPSKLKYKYYGHYDYEFYESIFDYIVGINTFDSTLFEKEVKEKSGIVEGQDISESYKVYNEINSDYIFEISNEEYKKLLYKMLEYVDIGDYRLEDYVGIYNHVIKYNNPLGIAEEDLKERIIRGIEKGKDRFTYNPDLFRRLPYFEKSDKQNNIEGIIEYCLAINKEKEEEKYRKDSVLLETDFELWCQKVKEEYNNIPIFTYIDSLLIFDFYNKNIRLRQNISDLIKDRITYSSVILRSEIVFYRQLQESIEEREKELKSGPEWYTYNKFNELLKKIIDIADQIPSN
ncbi:KAP family P-loop domain protein [Capnocytophaga sp. CM59]|nr:KAP family P-loop domain protein [Capnocytophaga sp. CM59]